MVLAMGMVRLPITSSLIAKKNHDRDGSSTKIYSIKLIISLIDAHVL